jgi:hypothetical protein
MFYFLLKVLYILIIYTVNLIYFFIKLIVKINLRVVFLNILIGSIYFKDFINIINVDNFLFIII